MEKFFTNNSFDFYFHHQQLPLFAPSQQYQMSEATWRNFCLKVADSLCTDSSNEVYDSNKIINYIYNANDACNIDHRVSYIVNDSSTPSSPNNNLSSFTSTTPKVCIFCLKYFLSKYSFIFSSTELCTQEPSYLVRSKVHLSICKVCLSACLLVCLFAHLLVCLLICLSV